MHFGLKHCAFKTSTRSEHKRHLCYVKKKTANSPGNFEDAEETDTAQHRYTNRWDNVHLHEYCLEYPTTHHKAVKPIKERYEVDLEAEAVHLHQHLQGEQGQQDLVGSF